MSDSKLILVVDDDTDLVEMVSMKLESAKFRVPKHMMVSKPWIGSKKNVLT